MDAKELQHKLAGRARSLIAKGKARKAEYMLWEILRDDPIAPTSTFMLGVSILLQGRHADGRRLIERAYALRPRVADHFVAPDRQQRLEAAALAFPEWEWPRYQLARDRWQCLGLTLAAALEHRAARTNGRPKVLKIGAGDGRKELRSAKTEIATFAYRDRSPSARLDLCVALDQAGFLWVFDDDQLLALRRDLFRDALGITDQLADRKEGAR